MRMDPSWGYVLVIWRRRGAVSLAIETNAEALFSLRKWSRHAG